MISNKSQVTLTVVTMIDTSKKEKKTLKDYVFLKPEVSYLMLQEMSEVWKITNLSLTSKKV